MSKDKAVFVRLEQITHEALKEEAARQNRTMSNLAGLLIEDYLYQVHHKKMIAQGKPQNHKEV